MTMHTLSEPTVGDMNLGRTSDEFFRGLAPFSLDRLKALDMREAKLPTMRSTFDAAELAILQRQFLYCKHWIG